MIDSRILDGSGSANIATVGSQNQLIVSVVPDPIKKTGAENRLRFLSGLCGLTGLDSGATNMAVNGSVNPVEFCVTSEIESELFITKIVFYLQDGTVAHDRFGALSALSVGIDIIINESGRETSIVSGAKTFYQMMLQTTIERPFGDGVLSFEVSNVSGNEDAQILPFTISDIIPGGLRLGRGTTDKFVVRVNDNLTALTDMGVRILGYRKFS